ncbi:hypothetical protein LY90DRAFT_520022 [Neocallimastix californiae]|uniref:Uncharacterized protein n=1 Tax=Neocallimastix californiae TaxID=1754190 RepID=A0A1Y1YJH4_9FUNG|nr:hypothetical protein LY90DRAFT_520022 [Neocallimastix californiae]|eukprot:ORX98013.1 hypothetical protein LY90DRAFT_520022 [Neocallimastix californiae]
MSKTFEENTEDFYKELNGECDPKKLLYIAEQGIFLKEPLFKYDKIKDHEYVVDISVISNQYFLINNNKQYNRIKYFFKENDYIYDKYRHLNRFCFSSCSLIIINKYFIDKLLNEKDEKFLKEVIYLLEDFIKINEKNIGDILMKILIEFGNDINILNYCLDKVKRYNIKIESIGGYRVPMHYCFETLKYYSDKLCIKNHLYLKCEDKYFEEFINTCFTDEFLDNFHNLKSGFSDLFSKKYNIDFYEIDKKFEVIDINKNNTNKNETNKNETNKNETNKNETNKNETNKNETNKNETNKNETNKNETNKNETNKNETNKNETNKNETNKNETNKNEINKNEANKNEYIYYIPSQLVNIIDPQYKGKLSYIKSYVLNPGDINYDFIKKYLKNYKRIDRILKDPNYILNLDVVINNYTDCFIIKLCYLASLIHNNYSKFIIHTLIYFDEYWYNIVYRKNQIVFFYDEYGRYKCPFYIRKIFKLLMNTPHKLFNSYFYC